MVESAPPRQSVVRLFPLVFCCCLHERLRRIFSDNFPRSKILAGNSPAGPPSNARHDDGDGRQDDRQHNDGTGQHGDGRHDHGKRQWAAERQAARRRGKTKATGDTTTQHDDGNGQHNNSKGCNRRFNDGDGRHDEAARRRCDTRRITTIRYFILMRLAEY